MRRVMIVSYHFFNGEHIASMRAKGLARYLKEFGWDPIVLTPRTGSQKPTENRVVETVSIDTISKWKTRLGLSNDTTLKQHIGARALKNRKTLVDRGLTLWEELFAFPDLYRDWRSSAVLQGASVVENEGVDAIIGTFGPPSSLVVARGIKKRTHVPWIADMQDLWTQSPYYAYSPIRKMAERRLEVDTIADADELTTVTHPLAEKLKELHKREVVHTIPFGFDPSQENPGMPVSSSFRIVYTGALYHGKRDPEKLLRAIRNLIERGEVDSSLIKIDFYGENEEWLQSEVRDLGLQDVVRINGPISREKSIEQQRNAQMLLLLTWLNPADSMFCPGKLYDYLAARRPILSIGLRGSVVESIVTRTNAGFHVFETDEMEEVLEKSYSEFKSSGCVPYSGYEAEIGRFSQRVSAKYFADLLSSLV